MVELFEKPKPAEVEALLATLLEGADPDMFAFPIDLPERLTPAPGVTLLASPGDGYAYTSTYVEKPPSYLGTGLQMQTVIGAAYRPLDYDKDAFRAMAVWWSKQSL